IPARICGLQRICVRSWAGSGNASGISGARTSGCERSRPRLSFAGIRTLVNGSQEDEMSHPRFAALVSVIAIVCLSAPASGQTQSRSAAGTKSAGSVPRTPDGRPDLTGIWTTQTFTPLERPDHLAGKEFFTAEEAEALQQQLTVEGADPIARDALNIEDPE